MSTNCNCRFSSKRDDFYENYDDEFGYNSMTPQRDLPPTSCPIGGLSASDPNCSKKCAGIIATNPGCKESHGNLISTSYCDDQCTKSSSGGGPKIPGNPKNCTESNPAMCGLQLQDCCVKECGG